MKKTKFYSKLLFAMLASAASGLVVPSALAENKKTDQSGWYNLTAEAVSSAGIPSVAAQALSPQNDVLSAEVPAEVTELASALGNDPLLIYEYIRNHYDYVPYFGQLKGSLLTVYDQSGNDIDLAVLLVDLLKVSGLKADLVYGRANISLGQMANLLGVEATTGTVSRVLAQGGIPHTVSTTAVELDRVWVSLNIDGHIFQVDPAFKQYEEIPGIDLASAMQYSRADLLNSAGGTVGTDYIQNLNLNGLKTKLTDLSSTLLSYLQTNYPHTFMKDVIGGRKIISVESENGMPPENLPYSYWVNGYWGAEVPDEYVHTVHVQYGGIDATYAIPNIAGRKLALTFPVAGPLPPDDDMSGSGFVVGESGVLEKIVPVNYVLSKTVEQTQDVVLEPNQDINFFSTIQPQAFAQVLDFGRIPQGVSADLTLSVLCVTRYTYSGWKGQDRHETHEYYTSLVSGSGYTQNGTTSPLGGLHDHPLKITYRLDGSGQSRGVKNGSVVLSSTFGANYNYTLSGAVAYPLNVSESYGKSALSGLGTPVVLNCRLKNSGELPLELKSMELTGDGKGHFELLTPNIIDSGLLSGPDDFNGIIAPGASLDIPVRYKSQANGTFKAQVDLSLTYDGVKYDGTRFKKISLSVVGKTEAAVAASGHDFGITYIDTPRRGVCSIKNNDSDLTITNIHITGTNSSNFTIVSGAEPGTVAHGENRYVEVDYVSSEAGTHSALLQVDYTLNGTSGVLKLPLDGETTDTLRARLSLDDKLLAEESEGDTNEYTGVLTLTVYHPYAAQTNSYADKTSLFNLNRGSAYVLVTDFGGSRLGRLLEKEQRKLAFMYSEENKNNTNAVDDSVVSGGETNAVSPLVATEETLPLLTQSLQVIGQTWMQETTQTDDLLAQMAGVVLTRHHRIGIVALTHSGHYIDVKNQVVSTTSKIGNRNDEAALYRTLSLFHSAFEHGALEQLQYADSAVSTVRLLDVANRLGLKIYKVDATNFDAVRPLLTSYTDEVLDGFETDIKTDGYTLILPESGSVPFHDWKGLGYIKYNENATNGPTFAMIIDSEYNGAWNAVWNFGYNYIYTPIYNAVSYVYHAVAPTISKVIEMVTPKSVEPVDLATGAYLYDRTDLVVGSGTAPMGMAIKRSYSSQNNFNFGPFGCGWSHNYDAKVTQHASVQNALGGRRPQDGVTILVAARACLDIMQTVPTNARTWVVESLISEWAVDNVISNTATINYDGKRLSYTRLPDGTFIAPPGVNMTLTKDANARFRLEGRYGDVQQFDTNNCLSTWSDADGHTLTVSYADKKVHEINDASGRKLHFEYTASGAIDFIEEFVGGVASRKVDYQYDNDRNLVNVKDPEGNYSYFKYDGDHQIVELSNHDKELLVINTYNALGKVTAQSSLGENVWNFGYAYYQTREENPLGGVNTYFFDETRRQIGFKDASGYKTTSEYDGSGHVVKKTSPADYATRYLYDGKNRLVSTTYPGGGGVSSNQYDALHRLTVEIDPEGRKTEYVYTAGSTKNRPDFVRVYTNATQYTQTAFVYHPAGDIKAGLVNTITDPEGHWTQNAYDAYGALASVTVRGDGVNPVHQMHYNARGDLEYEINANGIKTAYGYNANRQRTDTWQYDGNNTETAHYVRTYDANGDLVKETGPGGFEKRYAYSPFKKITHEWTANNTASPDDDPVVTYTYDERDWLAKVTDPLGRETVNIYNSNQQIGAVKTPLGTTTYTYNKNGEQETVTDALGWSVKTVNDITNLTSTVTEPYKGSGGNPAAVPSGTPVVTKTFNKTGQMMNLLNRRSLNFELGYNAEGKQTDFYTPLRKRTQTAYTPRGAVDHVTEPSGQVTTYGYYPDSGRLKETVDGVGTTRYTYDAIGNILSVSNQQSKIVNAYDFAGRVTNLVSSGSLLSAPCTLQFGYDSAGRMTKLVYPDGKEVGYAYYTNGLLKTVTDWGSRVTAYEYYPDGRLSKITRPNSTTRTQQYALDGRLSRAEERTSSGHVIALYQYNYNKNGTLESRFAVPVPQAYKLPEQTFTYDNDNRIATHNGAAVTYDDDGNLLSDPMNANAPTNFVYNARNFLIRVDSSNSWAEFSYDVSGNRIGSITRQSSLITTNSYVVNPNSSLSQVLVREKNGQKIFYVYGLGLEYEVSQSGVVRYYHYDQTGSTVALSDGAGQVTDRMEYSPYGTVTRRTGTSDTPFLYVGKYGVQTDANGLLYVRARYYSPQLHRFLNSDPIRFGGGLNFFAYANGNPLEYIDPLGTYAVDNTQNTFGEIVGQLQQLDVLTAARLTGGYLASYLTGDIFDNPSTYAEGMKALTINGIWNNRTDADNIRTFVGGIFGVNNTASAVNGTHYLGLGDLLQTVFETAGLITTPSVSAANMLRQMGGGDVVAHSQGASVFRGAVALLDKGVLSNTDYQGFGGQVFFQQGDLRSVSNTRNSWDVVPFLDPMNLVRRIGSEAMLPGSGTGHRFIQYKSNVINP